MALDVTFVVKPLYVASRRKKSNHFGLPRPPSRILTFAKANLLRSSVFPRGHALTNTGLPAPEIRYEVTNFLQISTKHWT